MVTHFVRVHHGCTGFRETGDPGDNLFCGPAYLHFRPKVVGDFLHVNGGPGQDAEHLRERTHSVRHEHAAPLERREETPRGVPRPPHSSCMRNDAYRVGISHRPLTLGGMDPFRPETHGDEDRLQ